MRTKAKSQKRRKSRAFEQCAYCTVKAAHPELLNHTFGKGSAMIVVTDVETMVCDNCGRQYFTGETLKKLDQVLMRPTHYAERELVNVASLSAV